MKLTERKAEVGTAVAGDWAGGVGRADVGGVIYCGSLSGTSIKIVDVGHVPAYW